MTVVEALRVVAAVVDQKPAVRGGFDAFGNHLALQRVGQTNNQLR